LVEVEVLNHESHDEHEDEGKKREPDGLSNREGKRAGFFICTIGELCG
jgi:hypothetical protein